MPQTKIGDLEIYYELHGRGEPLVMIMGLGADVNAWEPETIRLLARDFRVLVFDNRDAGRTRGPDTPYTIKDMAADTVRLMDHVGFARANVLGVSMGGMIAQELALGHPERVNRLILGCTSPGNQTGVAPSDEVRSVMLADQTGLPAWRLSLQMAKVTLAPGWMLTHFWKLPFLAARTGRYPATPAGYQRQMAAIVGFEAGERLRELKVPTLIVHGDRDILLPPGNADRLAELIPGAEKVVYAGAAHGFTTERPRVFARTVRDFLLQEKMA